MRSRRDFLATSSRAVLASTLPAFGKSSPAVGRTAENLSWTERIPVDRHWFFRTDQAASGESGHWYQPDLPAEGWTPVRVPHTWQVTPGLEDYRGIAWYRCLFDGRPEWAGKSVRIEFEAVFHSATLWANGKAVGEHLRKGYTTFSLDITPLLRLNGRNVVAVKVDNAFDDAMLPRGRSSDWAHDGGIYRPVWLLVTPPVWIERVAVEAIPDLANKTAAIEVTATVRNATRRAAKVQLNYRVEDGSHNVVVASESAAPVTIPAAGISSLPLSTSQVRDPQLWHFDRTNLYRLELTLSAPEQGPHQVATRFGIRRIEVRNGGFYLNGERVRLMGVERMAGSNPEFGMAEPGHWITHDHDELKELNCIFTRAHWPQDHRVLDYCDRQGILFQSEVPAWGPNTFKGMAPEPLPALVENGLEQLTEMIERDRNHPCIFSWGLSNEIGGQNPPAYQFVKRMYEQAKKLDPHRLCSYASNSLEKTPAKDVAAIMDFVEWNEYYESWYGGTTEDLRRNLKQIHEAFPDKPIVISEYGYCACTPDRPEGDRHRIEVLRNHSAVAREMDFIGGLIFFCYNDYRTHVGDKGLGLTKQRVHGVVDLYGVHKPSYEVLRGESSPVLSIAVQGQPTDFAVTIEPRNTLPAYALEGYKLRGLLYGAGNIPLERVEIALPRLLPDEPRTVRIGFTEKAALRIQFDLLRPTEFSALTQVWIP